MWLFAPHANRPSYATAWIITWPSLHHTILIHHHVWLSPYRNMTLTQVDNFKTCGIVQIFQADNVWKSEQYIVIIHIQYGMKFQSLSQKLMTWPTSSWNAILPLVGWWVADDTDIRPKLQMIAWQQPYHGSSSYSQPHYRGPIPHQFVLDLWWTECQWDRVFSKDFRFPVTTLPSVIHTHFIHPIPILWNISK
jgi:hypothetical protein